MKSTVMKRTDIYGFTEKIPIRHHKDQQANPSKINLEHISSSHSPVLENKNVSHQLQNNPMSFFPAIYQILVNHDV